jgi:hypothetical protein
MPATLGVEGTENLPSMVFAAVVTSIGIFAVGFRKVRLEAAATIAAAAPAPTGSVTQISPEVAAQAMPDGMLPLGLAAAQLSAPIEPAPAEVQLPIRGDLMLDGQPLIEPSLIEPSLIEPPVIEPPKFEPPKAERPVGSEFP